MPGPFYCVSMSMGSATNASVDNFDGDARPIDVLGKGDGVDDYDMGSDEFIP